MQSSGEGLYPVGAVSPSSPGLPQASGYKTFDIAVSPDVSTQVESPLRVVYPVSDIVPLKTRMRPFVPVIIGVLVIILIVIGSLVVSGNWNPLGAGNTTNSTAAAMKNTTSAKVTATPTPKATSTKPAATPTPTPTLQSYSDSDIGNHLVDIAFGPDNTVIQKPKGNVVSVSVSGSYKDSDIALLNNFTEQFNDYSTTTRLSTNVNANSGATIWLGLLPEDSLNQLLNANSAGIVTSYKNFQTGKYYFIQVRQTQISDKNAARTYINSDLTGNERNHWILRALLYNLGFSGETTKYTTSIFYSGQRQHHPVEYD